MSHRVRQASLHVCEGHSVLVPVVVDGLPERIEALGETWQRRSEFHLTAVPAAALERVRADRLGLWQVVGSVLSGRTIGPISVLPELRRASDPSRPNLRTLIATAEAPGLTALLGELSAALGVVIEPPPAFITLYSTDSERAIDLDDLQRLRGWAPALPMEQQAELRRAMRFEEILFDDDGIPAEPVDDGLLALGAADRVFTPEVMRALAYAAHVHRYQRRKATGIPYLAHLISVAALVAEDGGDEREVIVALLHDTAEDHGGEARLTDVRRRFGAEVESMVRALSDSLAPAGALKESWRPRKQRYLDHLRTERREGVLRVSNADKLHNARAILADHRHVGEAIWRRFEGSPALQLWYYSELSAIFTVRRPDSPLARELAETVRQLKAETQTAATP